MSARKRFVAGVAVCAMLALAFAPAGAASSSATRYRPAVLDRVLAAKLVAAKPAQVLETIVSTWDRAALRELDSMKVRSRKLQVLPMAFAKLTPRQITRLMGVNGVRSVYAPREYRLSMNEAAPQMGARYVADQLKVDGTGATIAVIDTGVDALHPDLTWHDKVIANYEVLAYNSFDPSAPLLADVPNTDDDSHGTHVSGTIAGTGAAGQEGKDLRGIAPGAKLVVYSANVGILLSSTGTTAAFDHIVANAATTGVRAISNSWGGSDGANFDPNDPTAIAQEVSFRNGIVPVFAASNSGPGDNTLSQQCVSPFVVCVGAITKHNQIVTFSSRGRPQDNHDRALALKYKIGLYRPTIVAPGVNIVAAAAASATADADRPYGYQSLSGTSMSTPATSGVIALLVSANPKLTASQIVQILEGTADPIPGWDAHEQGAGAVNARRAVEAALALKAGRRPALTAPKLAYVPPARSKTQLVSFEGSALPGAFVHGQGVETHEFTVPAGVERLQAKLSWPTPAENLYMYIWAPGDEPNLETPTGAPYATQESWGLLCDLGPCTLTGREGIITYPQPGTWKLRVYGRTLATNYHVEIAALRYALPTIRAASNGAELSGAASFPAVEPEPRVVGPTVETALANPTLKRKTLYFHGTSPVGNLDVAAGSDPEWDATAPTGPLPKSSHANAFLNAEAPDNAPLLARFSGTLDRHIEGDIILNLWAGATASGGALADLWDVAILSGDEVLAKGGSGWFTLSEVPTPIVMAIRGVSIPAGTEISLHIKGSLVTDAHSAIYYDSATTPSSMVLPEVSSLQAGAPELAVPAIVAEDLRTGIVRLGWDPVPGAASYRVYRETASGLRLISTISNRVRSGARPAPLTVEETIAVGDPALGTLGLGATESEFFFTCTADVATQGVDGWVFEIPEGAGNGRQTITVTGPGEGLYDLDVRFYDAHCSPLDADLATENVDESGPIPAGTRYVVVHLWIGVNIPFKAVVTLPAKSGITADIRNLTHFEPASLRVASVDAKDKQGPLSNIIEVAATQLERVVEISADGEHWMQAPATLASNGRSATFLVNAPAMLARMAGVSSSAGKTAVWVRARAGQATSAPVKVNVIASGAVRPTPDHVLPATGIGGNLTALVLLATAVLIAAWRRSPHLL